MSFPAPIHAHVLQEAISVELRYLEEAGRGAIPSPLPGVDYSEFMLDAETDALEGAKAGHTDSVESSWNGMIVLWVGLAVICVGLLPHFYMKRRTSMNKSHFPVEISTNESYDVEDSGGESEHSSVDGPHESAPSAHEAPEGTDKEESGPEESEHGNTDEPDESAPSAHDFHFARPHDAAVTIVDGDGTEVNHEASMSTSSSRLPLEFRHADARCQHDLFKVLETGTSITREEGSISRTNALCSPAKPFFDRPPVAVSIVDGGVKEESRDVVRATPFAGSHEKPRSAAVEHPVRPTLPTSKPIELDDKESMVGLAREVHHVVMKNTEPVILE